VALQASRARRSAYPRAVPKPAFIEMGDRHHPVRLPILYEDRSVLAIDKAPGWMLVPFSWQRTGRNLQAAISSSIGAGDFWARSRNLKFLRHVHRLDAETSGVLLFARSLGAVDSISDLFEDRRMSKRYLAVVHGAPAKDEWMCDLPIAPEPSRPGRMRVNGLDAKPAETHFRVLQRGERMSLLEARPTTGRTHQIRLHAVAAGHPIVGDQQYGDRDKDIASKWLREEWPLGLRAVSLAYTDPFTRRPVRIQAPTEQFCRAFGFADAAPAEPKFTPPVVTPKPDSARPRLPR
jgi:RluA family pseudouridine synthase